MEAHHWHDVTVLMIPIAGVWSKLTCAGLKTSWAHRQQDVTVLAISITGIGASSPRVAATQVALLTDGSGALARTSGLEACLVRSETCQSVTQKKKQSAHHATPSLGGCESSRYESEQGKDGILIS